MHVNTGYPRTALPLVRNHRRATDIAAHTYELSELLRVQIR